MEKILKIKFDSDIFNVVDNLKIFCYVERHLDFYSRKKGNYADFIQEYLWVKLHKYFVTDPENANFYLIPIFSNNGTDEQKVFDTFDVIYNKYPYLKQSIFDGICNHIIIPSPIDKILNKVIPEKIKKSIIYLNVNSNPTENFDKNIDVSLVPCFKNYYSEKYEMYLKNDIRNRLTKVLFIGSFDESRHSTRAHIMKNILSDVRILNNEKWVVKNQTVTTKTIDVYEKRLSESIFSLVIRGDCVWSPRVAEVIVHGCIPVIILKNYILPFEDIIDWDKFAIIINEDHINVLYDTIENLTSEKILELRENVLKVSDFFKYNTNYVHNDASYLSLVDLCTKHIKM